MAFQIGMETGPQRAGALAVYDAHLGYTRQQRIVDGTVHKGNRLVCGHAPHICFLFRLNIIGLTPAIVRLLEDTTVTKIGLSWHDDINGLHKMGHFETGTFIDIQDHVREIGVEDLSLQKLYANLFGQQISKAQRLTNWERDVLTDKQKTYAATDAWACIQLYEELERLKQTGEYELLKIED